MKQSNVGQTQTSADLDDSISIACYLCIYIATCEEELNWHLCEEHGKDDQLCFTSDFPCDICGKWCRSEEDLARHEQEHEANSTKDQSSFHCNFCNEKPNNIKELMLHKKKEHLEKVSLSWKYSSGTCEFGDLNCWFSHSGTTPESSLIKCKVCDETFTLLP